MANSSPDLERGNLTSDYTAYKPANLEPTESSKRKKPVHADIRSGNSYDEHPWLLHAGDEMGEGITANVDRKQSRPLRLKLPGFGKHRSRGELMLLQMEENEYVECYSKFPDETRQHASYKRMKEYGKDIDNEPKPGCVEDLVGCVATCMRSLRAKYEDTEEGSRRYSCAKPCAKACRDWCAGLVWCRCCDHLPRLPDSLRRMRWQGVKMLFRGMKDVYRNTIIGSMVSDAEVYIQFLLTVMGLILQVFSLEKQVTTVAITNVVLASILVVFGIFNFVVHFYAWRLSTIVKWRKFIRENKKIICSPKLWWKKWKRFCRESREEVALRVRRANERDSDDEEDEELNSDEDRNVQSADDAESIDDAKACCHCCTCSCGEARKIDIDHFIENCLGSSGDRSKAVARVFDLVRVMFGEMLYYPRMILAAFQVIQAIYHLQLKDSTAEIVIDVFQHHTTQYVSFGITMFQMLINVYFSRIFFLLALVYSIQKKRRKKKNLGTFGIKGSEILLLFCLFLIGQMFIQVVIVTQIAGVYAIEFEMHLNSSNSNIAMEAQVIEVPISWSLWYMILYGYIIIWLSSLAFLGLHYYSLQKFLIQMVIDVWKKKDLNKIIGIVKQKKKDGHYNDEKESNQVEQEPLATKEAVSNNAITEEEVTDELSTTEEEDRDEQQNMKEDGQSVAEKAIKEYKINCVSTIISPFSFPASFLFLSALAYYLVCATSNLLQMSALQFANMTGNSLVPPFDDFLINPSDNCSLVDPPTTINSTCSWTYGWFVYLCFTFLISEIINSHFVAVVIITSVLPLPLFYYALFHTMFMLVELCMRGLSQLPCPSIHLDIPCQSCIHLLSLIKSFFSPNSLARKLLITFIFIGMLVGIPALAVITVIVFILEIT